MGQNFVAAFNIGVSLLLGSYIFILAPRRRVNQLFAFILIEVHTVNILTPIGKKLQSTTIAYIAAYGRLFVETLVLAAAIHFALSYPKRKRMSLETFKRGVLLGVIIFDAVALVIITAEHIRDFISEPLILFMLYIIVTVILRPRQLPKRRVRNTIIVGVLIVMMAVSLTENAFAGEVSLVLWGLLTVGAIGATLFYMWYIQKERGALLTPTQWMNWGRWQVLAIYITLGGFTTFAALFEDLKLTRLGAWKYVVSMGEGFGVWIGLMYAIAISLILVILWDSYRSAPRQHRKPIWLLLIGFSSYFSFLILKSSLSKVLGFNEQWLWIISSTIFTATVGLAIVKFRFLDAALDTVTEIVNSTLDIELVLEMVLEQLDAVLDFTNSSVMLVEREQLRVRAHTDKTLLWHSFPITADSVTKELLEDKHPILVKDLHKMPAEYIPMMRGEQIPPRSLIAAPLIAREQVIGVISAGHQAPYRYNKMDLHILIPFAHQIAVAVDNARLYEAQKRRAAALAQAQQLFSAISVSLELNAVLRITTAELTPLFGVDHSGIVLFDEAKASGRVVAEYPNTDALGIDLQLNYPAAQELIRTKQPVAIDDLENDTRMGRTRDTLLQMGIHSILIAPLVVQDNVIGSIGLDMIQKQRYWSAEDLDLCRIITAQIASAIANAQAYEQEQQARQLADTLRKVSNVVGSTLDLDEVLLRILDELHQVLPYDGATVLWCEGDKLYARARRAPEHDKQSDEGLSVDKYFTFSHVMGKGEPLIISDTKIDARWVSSPAEPTRSWIGMPLRAKGQVAGMLSIKGYTPNMYSETDLPLVNAFATQVAIAVENARLYELEIKQIEREMAIARDTQMSLLPDVAPEVPPFEIAGYSLPAKNVGGDFFQYYHLDGGKFGLAVGDVSGKGMPAALMMAVSTGTLDALMLRNTAPGALLARVNEVLTPHGQRSRLNSACCISIFEPRGNVVHTANAGFIAPILLRGDDCSFVDVVGLPLGMVAEVSYRERRLNFAPDDMFIFCSDGIVEAMNARAKIYGFERLLARIAKVSRAASAPAVIEWVLQDVRAFVGGAEQHDDMTMVVIKVV